VLEVPVCKVPGFRVGLRSVAQELLKTRTAKDDNQAHQEGPPAETPQVLKPTEKKANLIIRLSLFFRTGRVHPAGSGGWARGGQEEGDQRNGEIKIQVRPSVEK
jgi:hypothetical protein